MLELIFETLECIDQELCFQPRAGALQQLGHMDFYPDGGSSQVPSYIVSLIIVVKACQHSACFHLSKKIILLIILGID